MTTGEGDAKVYAKGGWVCTKETRGRESLLFVLTEKVGDAAKLSCSRLQDVPSVLSRHASVAGGSVSGGDTTTATSSSPSETQSHGIPLLHELVGTIEVSVSQSTADEGWAVT